MENNQAVRNQKVFITLASGITIARHYDVVCNRVREAEVGSASVGTLLTEKRTLEFVIDTLQLPIEKRLASPHPKAGA